MIDPNLIGGWISSCNNLGLLQVFIKSAEERIGVLQKRGAGPKPTEAKPTRKRRPNSDASKPSR